MEAMLSGCGGISSFFLALVDHMQLNNFLAMHGPWSEDIAPADPQGEPFF